MITKTPRLLRGSLLRALPLALAAAIVPASASGKEWALLLALVREPLRVMIKAELLRDVWGYASPCRT